MVTPTNSASPSPWAATELPQMPQNPRWESGEVLYQVGSPPGPTHSNPFLGKSTHDVTGPPESL